MHQSAFVQRVRHFFGVILNLVSIPDYYDVALRDLGLAPGAFALSRLAEFDSRS
ncbi:MAG: hypothetical protein ACJ731_07900 [Vicinamibacterales bacterium]